MFLCGNTCTGGDMEPEVTVKEMPFEAKIMTAIAKTRNNRSKKNTHIMIKPSKYNQYIEECKLKNTKFTDKDFAPNNENLKFKIQGRKITWQRLPDVVPGCVMVEDEFSPNDIQQGNIGDCYFLSSIAALATDQERIQVIFHDNFKINQFGIYNVVVNKCGVPIEMVIDDYIPVFADTNRPVFCKATGREIWVILLEKAWAKIKGSYGDISAGCPHEVLQTFSVAPCYYYQIEDETDVAEVNKTWFELTDAANEMMPVVAGTKQNVDLSGLQPGHAYTVIDSANVTSRGKVHRIMRLRNPWGKTEYKGKACQTDNQFWDSVQQNIKKRMRPSVGVNDGDFSMPFEEFMRNFNSIDISSSVFGFSYEFEKLKMFKGEPLFIRFDVQQEHETFITVERKYTKGDTNQQVVTTDYGFSRLIIGHQRDQDSFEFYDAMLENDFPDITTYVKFKPGRYLMYVEVDDPRLPDNFEATFSYYYDTCETKQGKNYTIEYNQKYPKFLESVFMNHALRMNNQKSKIGPKAEDWVKTMFLLNQGGFGYVMVNLQHDTNIRVSVAVNHKRMKENDFYLMNKHPNQQVISAGESAIFVFSCIFEGRKAENYVFPPPGFRISRIA